MESYLKNTYEVDKESYLSLSFSDTENETSAVKNPNGYSQGNILLNDTNTS